MKRKDRVARGRAAAQARWDREKAAKATKPAAQEPARRRVSDEAVAASAVSGRRARNLFGVPEFPKQATPPRARLAQDSEVSAYSSWAWNALSSIALEGQTFLGYPYLAELSQRPEYRRMVEQFAFHMTRRWIRLKCKNSGDGQRPGFADEGPLPGEKQPAADAFPPAKPKPKNGAAPNGTAPPGEKLSAAGTPLVDPLVTQADREREQSAARLDELEAELDRLRVKQHFKEMVEQDGFFGRGHIYVDLGTTDVDKELETTIGNGRDAASKAKIRKGGLVGLKTVEPMWAYPMQYDAVDPLKPGWYRPDHWYVMRRQVHRTRLLTFVSREVPDLLKPAYAFGGMPLTQMAKPYVDNWLRTRQSVADLVNSFSQFVISTDVLAQIASAEGSAQLFKRLDVFNNTRSNRGAMVIDKDREELNNVSAPLGSLDALQAQAQEQMASVSGIPIMFLIGDQPTGLNASSEGAIRAFYDWVHAGQEFLFEKPLDALIAMAQLNIWGEVDPDITFEFVPLWTATEKEAAEMRKTEADRDAIYIGEGVIDADEVRKRLAEDTDSGYTLDLSKKIEPPAPELPPGFGATPGSEPDDEDAPNGAKPPFPPASNARQ